MRITPRQAELNAMAEKLRNLRSPTDILEAISLPPAAAIAFSTGRPELLKTMRPGPLTAVESAAMCHALGVLIETNQLLVHHARELGNMAANLSSQFVGVIRQFQALESFSQFGNVAEQDEEG